MKKNLLLLGLALLLVVSACDTTNTESSLEDAGYLKAGKKVLNFRAHLSGDQEVPVVMTEATGQAVFQLSKDGMELSYKLIVDGLENVTMAHLHMAAAGSTGAVVAWMYPSVPPPVLIPGVTSGILAEGVLTSANLRGALAGKSISDLVEAIYAGKIYVNAHTSKYPAGEIRGQLWGNLPGSLN